MYARYSISETANMLDIHRNTLRKYTKMGAIKCRVSNTNRKYYYGQDIIRFWNMKPRNNQ